jgi:hypothetical protein
VSTMRCNTTVNVMARNFRKKAAKEIIISAAESRFDDRSSDALSKIISNEVQSVYSKNRANASRLGCETNGLHIAEKLIINYLKVLLLRNKFLSAAPSKSGSSSDSF